LFALGWPCSAAAQFTEFPVTSPPGSITVGPDGALWFTESNRDFGVDRIGRITTAGVITEFPLPLSVDCQQFGTCSPSGITAGPDGNLWFVETLGNRIKRITTSGAITEFTIPTPRSFPENITVGPDGALWFTESEPRVTGAKIGRI